VEILLWLVPPAVVTVLAMAWVSWLGREGRGEIDHEEAARRLTKAMQRENPGLAKPRPVREPDRSTGVAVRRQVRRPLTRPVRRPGGSDDDLRGRRAS
jgi:hypothetical protein